MDKVIIDGVDVSECFWRATNKLGNDIGTYCRCYTGSCKKQTCYYKQLKRLQAENEELKNQYSFSTILKIDKLEQENERLKANKGRCAFKSLDNTFCPEVDKKITELKLSRDSYKVSYETAKKYREKAEKVLQEIRDIAEKEIVCDNCNFEGTDKCDARMCTHFYLNDFSKDILDKINKVIGAEE